MSFYDFDVDIHNKIDLFHQDNYTFLLHFHKCIELLYIEDGEMDVTVGTISHTFTKDEIAFIPPNTPHSITRSTANNMVILIPENYYQKLADQYHLSFNYFALTDTTINRKMYQFIQLLAELRENELVVSGIVSALLGIITHTYSLTVFPGKESQLILDFIKYLDAHFNQQITATEVAEHFGFSKTYFSKLFNRYFHCNFTTYINRLRVCYINNNLGKNDNNKIDLVFESGFSSLSTYYAFLEREKTNP